MRSDADFRTDINALRALAVTGVVLFHLDLPILTGGFAGVDVFFVISGYLMTKIILTNLQAGRFSLGAFFLARVRRIVPGLAVLVAGLLVIGWFSLPPRDFALLGRDAFASLTFTSNVIFAKKIDYFNQAQGFPSWLLHTWSLSLEWQFYLLYPIIVAAAYRIGGLIACKTVIVALGLVSGLLYLWLTAMQSPQAFYSLPARMWILSAGAMLFLWPRMSPSLSLSVLGLSLVLLSYLGIGGSQSAVATIISVIGAVLYIHGAAKSSWHGWRPVALLGAWSYSIYLWHWPIMQGFAWVGASGTLSLIAQVAVSILLGGLSFRFVESAFLAGSLGTGRARILVMLTAVVFSAAFARVVEEADGFPSRIAEALRPALVASQSTFARQAECMDSSEGCRIGAAAKAGVAVWGDSHASAMGPAFENGLRAASLGGVLFAKSACPPILGWTPKPPGRLFKGWSVERCQTHNRAVHNAILAGDDISHVFLVGNWMLYSKPETRAYGGPTDTEMSGTEKAEYLASSMVNTACSLVRAGKTVHLVAPVPNMPFSQAQQDLRSGFVAMAERKAEVSLRDYESAISIFRSAELRARSECSINVIEVWPDLCGAYSCSATFGNAYTFSDDNHLTVAGSELLTHMIHGAIRRPQ